MTYLLLSSSSENATDFPCLSLLFDYYSVFFSWLGFYFPVPIGGFKGVYYKRSSFRSDFPLWYPSLCYLIGVYYPLSSPSFITFTFVPFSESFLINSSTDSSYCVLFFLFFSALSKKSLAFIDPCKSIFILFNFSHFSKLSTGFYNGLPLFIESSIYLSFLISSSYYFKRASLGSSLMRALLRMFLARLAYRNVFNVSS